MLTLDLAGFNRRIHAAVNGDFPLIFPMGYNQALDIAASATGRGPYRALAASLSDGSTLELDTPPEHAILDHRCRPHAEMIHLHRLLTMWPGYPIIEEHVVKQTSPYEGGEFAHSGLTLNFVGQLISTLTPRQVREAIMLVAKHPSHDPWAALFRIIEMRQADAASADFNAKARAYIVAMRQVVRAMDNESALNAALDANDARLASDLEAEDETDTIIQAHRLTFPDPVIELATANNEWQTYHAWDQSPLDAAYRQNRIEMLLGDICADVHCNQAMRDAGITVKEMEAALRVLEMSLPNRDDPLLLVPQLAEAAISAVQNGHAQEGSARTLVALRNAVSQITSTRAVKSDELWPEIEMGVLFPDAQLRKEIANV